MADIKINPLNANIKDNNNRITCKVCGSNHTRKYGFVEGTTQYYFCNTCKHRFCPNDHLYKMKTSYKQVASAINDYYKGDSINKIRKHIDTHHDNYPSSKTVYAWIAKYTDEAIRQFKEYHPQAGSKWICDETVLMIGGKKVWCITVIDADTRFLLATRLSANRDKIDIKRLMQYARETADNTPTMILYSGWDGYIDGFNQAFGSNVEYSVTEKLDDGNGKGKVERWNSTFKDRVKLLRGLKSFETANRFLDGFMVWYNFMRCHELLNGKTPAEKARIKYTTKSWTDVVRKSEPRSRVLISPDKVVTPAR